MLEGSVGHVRFLLIGVNNRQLQVFSVIAEIRLQFEYFAVSGHGLIIPACYIENVTARVQRIRVARTNRHVGIIGRECAIEIASKGQGIAFEVQEIFAFRI